MEPRHISGLLEQADLAVAAGDWESVLSHTDGIIEQVPDHPDAQMLRGTALRQLAKLTPGLERRFLTVMFVDLVGSTGLSESLDPEDFAGLLHSYHELVAEAIAPYGGRVAKLLGDGVMAQFGYPTALEGAPRLACLAAFQVIADLEAQRSYYEQTIGRPLDCRVGLHSGTAVVESGDVVGDVPNVAAAIEGCAATGGVAVSDATRSLVDGFYEFEPVKSTKNSELEAFRITGRNPVEASPIGYALVGRSDELARLAKTWTLVQTGTRRTIAIVGEAGIGKSKLLAELHRIVSTDGDWVEGGAAEFRGAQPFHLFTEAIERRLRLHGIDQSNAAAVSVHLGTTEDHAQMVLSSARASTPAGRRHPAQVRRAVVTTIIGWIEKLARSGPVAVALEDLHWADPSSLELISELADATAELPVLIVATSRTTAALDGLPDAEVIELAPLDIGQSLELVDALAADLELPEALRATLADRAAGIPLFATELVRSLPTETGVDDDHFLPQSLRDLLASRLDSFGAAKRVAQVASVLGRNTRIELLHALDPELARSTTWLDELCAGGLLERTEGGARFGHSLIQDAAYESMLRSERRRLHARAAEAITQLVENAAPDVIAHHLTQSGDTLRAIESWIEAGHQAVSRSASPEAITHLRRAESLLDGVDNPDQRRSLEYDVQIALAAPLTAVHGYAAPAVEVTYQKAAQLAAETGDDRKQFASTRGYAATRLLRAEIRQADELGGLALEIANRADDEHLRLEALAWCGTIDFFAGRLDQADGTFDQAVATYDAARHRRHGFEFGIDPLTLVNTHRAWRFQLQHAHTEALALAETTVEHARSIEHPLSVAHALNYLAGLHQMQSDHDQQLAAAKEEVDLASEFGFVHYLHYGRLLAGHARTHHGDTAGVQLMREALADRNAAGALLAMPYQLFLIADGYQAIGEPTKARPVLDEAADTATRTGELWWQSNIEQARERAG